MRTIDVGIDNRQYINEIYWLSKTKIKKREKGHSEALFHQIRERILSTEKPFLATLAKLETLCKVATDF